MEGSRRLEFATTATWREANTMLQTASPEEIKVDQARCDIAFVHLTDLIEEGRTAVPVNGNAVTVHFHPFEMKTIRIVSGR